MAALSLLFAGAVAALPPTADFTVAPSVARADQLVGFKAAVAGSGLATIASVTWDLGDGTTGTGASLQHAYTTVGTKTVTMTAVDSNNEAKSVSHPVSVVASPAAGFSVSPTVPTVGAAVSFNGSTSSDPGGPINSYAWDFGDGSGGSGATASHTYSTSGDKAVTLTVTSGLDGQTATSSQTVHVNAPPKAAFVYGAVIQPPTGQDPLAPLVGQQATFSAQGSKDPDGTIVSYEWDLGTGSFGKPSTDPSATTSFATAGPRTIRLRVTDNNGGTDITSVRVRVNGPPVASLTFSPDKPAPNQFVSLSSTSTDPDGAADIVTQKWDLNGDGKYDDASGATASAVFTKPGDYTVGVQVTDSGRATSTAFQTVPVRGAPVSSTPQQAPAGSPAPFVVTKPSSGSGVGEGTPTSGANSTSSRPRAGLKALTGVRVQIAGSVRATLTKISQLIVTAPRGALVTVRCRGGKGCPKRALRRRVGSRKRVRLRALERPLAAGARIIVRVTMAGYMPRQTIFTIRRGAPPTRRDGCVMPGSGKPGRCPAS